MEIAPLPVDLGEGAKTPSPFRTRGQRAALELDHQHTDTKGGGIANRISRGHVLRPEHVVGAKGDTDTQVCWEVVDPLG